MLLATLLLSTALLAQPPNWAVGQTKTYYDLTGHRLIVTSEPDTYFPHEYNRGRSMFWFDSKGRSGVLYVWPDEDEYDGPLGKETENAH